MSFLLLAGLFLGNWVAFWENEPIDLCSSARHWEAELPFGCVSLVFTVIHSWSCQSPQKLLFLLSPSCVDDLHCCLTEDSALFQSLVQTITWDARELLCLCTPKIASGYLLTVSEDIEAWEGSEYFRCTFSVLLTFLQCESSASLCKGLSV